MSDVNDWLNGVKLYLDTRPDGSEVIRSVVPEGAQTIDLNEVWAEAAMLTAENSQLRADLAERERERDEARRVARKLKPFAEQEPQHQGALCYCGLCAARGWDTIAHKPGCPVQAVASWPTGQETKGGAPASPVSPSWADAPTAPGLWVYVHDIVTVGLRDIKTLQGEGDDGRVFGPIPSDPADEQETKAEGRE